LVTPEDENAHKTVTLGVEETTNLRIGELAVLHLPASSIYRQATINGAWEDVLVRPGHSGVDTVFCAVRPGPGCIVVTPDVPDGDCISCVTLHYFVQVSPKVEF
jgi:hypothetical protein